MLESDLRDWLKINWPEKKLFWVEAAMGGTVGFPDAVLRIGDRWVPTELKVGEELKGGFLKATVRPAQCRFHRLAAEAKSAFLVSTGDKGCFKLNIVSGANYLALLDGDLEIGEGRMSGEYSSGLVAPEGTGSELASFLLG